MSKQSIANEYTNIRAVGCFLRNRQKKFQKAMRFSRRVLGVVDSLIPTPGVKHIASGTALLFSGVALLTLNERRDVAQEKLRFKAASLALSLTETDVKNLDASQDGRLVHYRGTLFSDETPQDDDVGIRAPRLIRLRRTVEMYQWREVEHTQEVSVRAEKNGTVALNTSKEKTYTYEKVWSPVAQVVSHSVENRNPAFPSGLPGGALEISSKLLFLGQQDRLLLNDGLVDQVTDWKPIILTKEVFAEGVSPGALPYNLRVAAGGKMLSTSAKAHRPEIGDVRVVYDGVFSGPYTAVARASLQEESGTWSLIPFKGKLKSSLASQGEIRMPEDTEKLLGIKLDTFVIPESIISQMESVLLSLAPLQVNYIASGNKSLPACMRQIGMQDANTKQRLQVLGAVLNFAGCLSILGPVGLTTGGAVGALVVSSYLSYQAIMTAIPKTTGGKKYKNEEI